ncbi:hypothetical protein GN956_G1444 [Arapaima gigas]
MTKFAGQGWPRAQANAVYNPTTQQPNCAAAVERRAFSNLEDSEEPLSKPSIVRSCRESHCTLICDLKETNCSK